MSSIVLLIALGCVVLAISAVETGPNRSRELALVAALAAAAAGGRVLFAFIPNVQPVTMIVAVTGATPGRPRRASRPGAPPPWSRTPSSARARGRRGR